MNDKNITKNQPIYRCYIKDKFSDKSKYNDIIGNSLFDLIGKKEPDQTKSLGYVLARSKCAMENFLTLIHDKVPEYKKEGKNKIKKRINELLQEDYIVDCELMFQNDNGSSNRADIVIRFPKSQYAIIIEAKSTKIKGSSTSASIQGSSYADKMSIKNKVIISLTNDKELSDLYNNIYCIQWIEIINMFDDMVRNNPSNNAFLERDFLNYILKIKGYMKYYDIEVLSIPAGITIDSVKETGIYECPAEIAHYKSRGEHTPLFIAFRGKCGSVEKLYKLDQLLKMPIAGRAYESLKETLDPLIVERIEKYKNFNNFPDSIEELKYIFVLDEEKSIELPHEIKYKGNNAFVETKRPLKDYFAKPKNKEGVVWFEKM